LRTAKVRPLKIPKVKIFAIGVYMLLFLLISLAKIHYFPRKKDTFPRFFSGGPIFNIQTTHNASRGLVLRRSGEKKVISAGVSELVASTVDSHACFVAIEDSFHTHGVK
jgi:hypothetical protein